jgi:hypothetical protein
MGLGIYPVFKPKLRGGTFKALGEALARNYQDLDRLAQSHGLTPLTAFADNRPIPEGFNGPPEDLEELMGPWDEWFEAGEGKAAFRALADLLKNKPKVAKKLEEPEQVAEELEELARVLAIAERQAAKFHLEMS